MNVLHGAGHRPRPSPAPARLALALALAVLASACAERPLAPSSDCEARFREADQVIDNARARDQGPAKIPGFPYLRVDRLLASFRDEIDTPVRTATWVRALAALDAGSRTAELRNAGIEAPETVAEDLDDCRQALVERLLEDPQRLARLRHRAVVPDDYVAAWRVLGLYPLTALPMSAGIARWHREARATFATPLARLPVEGGLVRWHSAATVERRSYAPRMDALGIPRPDAAGLRALFDRHAPVWELDRVDDNDRIGTAAWRGKPVVDIGRATEYRHLSHARFGDAVLLQLNYVVWFRARPGNDIYAGDIDGLTWRVTLGPDGEPWLYDSIHNCGCYHQFFPTGPLRLRSVLPPGETPLVLPPPPAGRPVVRLDSGRHFIQRVYADRGQRPALALATAPYDRLRALPTGDGGWHSFFGPRGLVTGSERAERFLFWPMGIRSPGAMRQRGRHATAFVGRRHFDDPYLIETLFEAATP